MGNEFSKFKIDKSINYKNISNKNKFKKIKHLYHEYLPNYVNEIVDNNKLYKKSVMISQWLERYIKYQQIDDKILNKNNQYSINRKYARGQVLLVDFGFRVGRELGGFHYCIVLTHNDNKREQMIRVLPLSSNNKGISKNKLHNSKIWFGNYLTETIFLNIRAQLDAHIEQFEKYQDESNVYLNVYCFIRGLNPKETQETLSKDILTFFLDIDFTHFEPLDIVAKKIMDKCKSPMEDNIKNLYMEMYRLCINDNYQALTKHITSSVTNYLYLHSIHVDTSNISSKLDQLKKMKNYGTIGLLNQISTISKIRIIEPRNKKSHISDVKLNKSMLSIIDQSLIDYYNLGDTLQ